MIRAQLVEHPEHGILRLRDDYYARQRALIGGVILAGALILGQILAQRIGENVFAQLTQMVVSAAGLAYGLIYAAWPNNPRQTSLAVAGGTGALCLLTLAGGLLVMVLISVIGFLPSIAGGLPSIGGALLGVFSVLLGSVVGALMVAGGVLIVCLAGFITLRIAAGGQLDDELINETIDAVKDKTLFIPAVSWITVATLLAIAAVAILYLGTTRLFAEASASSGMSELASGLDYLLGFSDVGITLASEGSASLSDLLAGVLTAAAAALALGALLALPLAVTARSLLIYMRIGGADFSVAHAASVRARPQRTMEPVVVADEEIEDELPPIADDEESLANLDLREAIQRPEGWDHETGHTAPSEPEPLQIASTGTEVELEQRGAIPRVDE
ncbi:MAG: hypothetical protein VYB65_07105 [Myxococcota bacterium]|nr:hypothetical protein [Myxococcota bacterium]